MFEDFLFLISTISKKVSYFGKVQLAHSSYCSIDPITVVFRKSFISCNCITTNLISHKNSCRTLTFLMSIFTSKYLFKIVIYLVWDKFCLLKYRWELFDFKFDWWTKKITWNKTYLLWVLYFTISLKYFTIHEYIILSFSYLPTRKPTIFLICTSTNKYWFSWDLIVWH